MKTTTRGVILFLDKEQKKYIDELMKLYCTAVRFGFNRLLEGVKIQSIRKLVQNKYNLNSRQANDAVYEAQTIISSQKEMVKYHYENAALKVKAIRERLEKAKSPRKITGLTAKLNKWEKKLAKWQKHLDENTIPTVIFGGKKLFYERCKGNITKEEWQTARNNRYVSRGDKAKGGNLNTRLYEAGGKIYLEIAAEPVQVGKVVRYKRITVPVYLAHKPSKKTGKINGRNYRQMVIDYLKTGRAYQVEIIRENDRYYVHVTFEEDIPVPYKALNGAFGVDTNPAGLGVTQTDYLGNFKGSVWINCPEWTYARAARRENLIGETAKLVADIVKNAECALVVEDLKFKNDKDVSAKFNRISHGFIYAKFLQAVERRALREGIPLKKIKPAFTSIIGVLKYQEQYGISNHEAAAYVIARRGMGCQKE
ncbi:IS605 OrfB family transposase, partial [Desulfohalotomaculum tongense]|uniref:IS200/IS605 family accessory protein TnpB-related protein n=1 Tax=Desulforadius tongensis TaxID=1216062 RepID=UPI001958BC46